MKHVYLVTAVKCQTYAAQVRALYATPYDNKPLIKTWLGPF